MEDEFCRRILARKNLLEFITYVRPDYIVKWFHKVICKSLDDVRQGKHKNIMFFLPAQHGKLCSDSTPVFTPSGWTTHGKLQVGDLVFGRDGEQVIVTAISQPDYADNLITFSDGTSIIAHDRHEWVVFDRAKSYCPQRIAETHRMLKSGFTVEDGKRSRFLVDMNVCLEMNTQELPIPPYIVGAWLGDGSTTKNCITLHPDDWQIVEAFEQLGIASTSVCVHPTTKILSVYFRSLLTLLKSEGLLGFKHIPERYLCSSIEQRLELLAGLIDTDGYVYQRNGRITFSNTNALLIEQVNTLVHSLGWRTSISAFEPVLSTSGIQGKQTVYQLCFNPEFNIPTRLPRKQVTVFTKPRRRSIMSIEKCTPQIGRCIQVEGGVYLVGRTMIPTHNSLIASVMFPSHQFGIDPNHKFIHTSYGSDLVKGWNRQIQRVMDSAKYSMLFPNTRLNTTNVRTISGSYLRNQDEFEIVNHEGRYVCAGVGGGISGRPGDTALMDDLMKGYTEALSHAIRTHTWEWYLGELDQRTHNQSRKVLIMTRWNALDIAGRLEREQGHLWKIIRIPALCEDEEAELKLLQEVEPDATEPPRRIGEALWEEKFSKEKFEEERRLSPHIFTAVRQQTPKAKEGNRYKYDWLMPLINATAVPIESKRCRFWDLGGSDSSKADFTAGARCAFDERKIFYIEDMQRGQWSPAERNAHILATTIADNEQYPDIKTYIERGVGLAVEVTDTIRKLLAGYHCEIVSAKGDKETRSDPVESYAEGHNAKIVQDMPDHEWNTILINELTSFPNGTNDDQVDAISGAFAKLTREKKKRQISVEVIKTNGHANGNGKDLGSGLTFYKGN